MNADVGRLVDLLEKLLSSEWSCQEARAHLFGDSSMNFRNADTILSHLNHYLDDEDMRGRDEGHRAFQDGELRNLILRLRESDFNGAAEVSFLTRS